MKRTNIRTVLFAIDAGEPQDLASVRSDLPQHSHGISPQGHRLSMTRLTGEQVTRVSPMRSTMLQTSDTGLLRMGPGLHGYPLQLKFAGAGSRGESNLDPKVSSE